MKIAIGCDHGGLEHKNEIKNHLTKKGFEVTDFGINEPTPVDYPDIALKVTEAVVSKKADKGILVCGTGIGMSMAANKVKGIRAALCGDPYSAKYTRLHNDANILCLGGRVITVDTALELADIFLNTEFEGGRHQKRIDKISKIEG